MPGVGSGDASDEGAPESGMASAGEIDVTQRQYRRKIGAVPGRRFGAGRAPRIPAATRDGDRPQMDPGGLLNPITRREG